MGLVARRSFLGHRREEDPDPSGAVYKTSGKGYTKGEPKMVAVFEQNPTQAEMGDALWQLNRYRLFFEDRDFPVARMQLEIIVRDGGTWVARNRGVTEPIYVIPVPKINNIIIRAYFQGQAASLTEALATKTLPPPCLAEERWDGRRCRDYCDVAQFCDVGREEMKKNG